MLATVLPADAVAATIRTETQIAVSAAAVWAAVRDVGAVHKRLVPGFAVDTRLEEDVRVVTFADGLVLREKIVSVDDNARRLTYAAVESRATYHSASIQVVPEGQGARLIWITDFLPEELREFIGANMKQASSVMKKTLESAPRVGDQKAGAP